MYKQTFHQLSDLREKCSAILSIALLRQSTSRALLYPISQQDDRRSRHFIIAIRTSRRAASRRERAQVWTVRSNRCNSQSKTIPVLGDDLAHRSFELAAVKRATTSATYGIQGDELCLKLPTEVYRVVEGRLLPTAAFERRRSKILKCVHTWQLIATLHDRVSRAALR